MDQGGICGALVMDLSKAIDCLVHDFLIAKLEAYGFTYESLKLINSYLTDRKHRTKINSSSVLDLLTGVHQGSILGPLLFNICISDLSLFLDDDNVTSYADDTTPYAMKQKNLQVLKEIEDQAGRVFNWFSANYFKATSKKSHFLLRSNEQINLSLGDLIIETRKSQKLLGINISLHLTNTLLNYAKKQAKNYILLSVFQVI